MANLQKIKELIKQNNFTIRDFAAEIGMTEQGLQKLIRENSTKVDTLELIAEKLNVSVSIFFDSDSHPNYSDVDVIKSQQETINRQSKIIETLTNK